VFFACAVGLGIGALFAIASGRVELGLLGFAMGSISTLGLYRYIRSVIDEEEVVPDQSAPGYKWRWRLAMTLPLVGSAVALVFSLLRYGDIVSAITSIPVGFIMGASAGTVFWKFIVPMRPK
jgi:hypothetical protein